MAVCKSDPERLIYIKTRIFPLLTKPAFLLLTRLFQLLHTVQSHASINKMTSHNLAIVWTPNLVKSDDVVTDFTMCNLTGGTVGTLVRLCIDAQDN